MRNIERRSLRFAANFVYINMPKYKNLGLEKIALNI